MPGPAQEMAISRPLPMAFAEHANPVRQERGAPQQGNRGDIHIYRNPSILYQEIPYHQIPGNPLSSEAPGFLRKYQKFPDPCAKDSNLHQTNGKHKEKPHASLQNMWLSVAPQEGLEPTTLRLTAECSAIELLRQMGYENFFSYPYGIRRRPTLPGRVQPSTIGAEGLNFCVRYGNRWNPFAIATGNCWLSLSAP